MPLTMLAALMLQPPVHCLAGPMPEVAPPECPQWQRYWRNEIASHYLDPAMTRYHGKSVELTVMGVAVMQYSDRVSRIASRIRFDCPAGTITVLYWSQYDHEGRAYYRAPPSPGEAGPWPALEDDRLAGLFRQLCGPARERETAR